MADLTTSTQDEPKGSSISKLRDTLEGIRLELTKEGAALEFVCSGLESCLDESSDLDGNAATGIYKIIADSGQHVLSLAADVQDAVAFIDQG